MVNNITSSTADLSFTGGGASDHNVQYGPSGFSLGTGMMMNLTSSFVNIAGLSANTAYDVYVRDSCGVGDVSNWSGPLSFTTLCSPFTAPFSENFDAATTPALPLCWSKIEGGNAIQTVTSTDHWHSFAFFTQCSRNK
ncbi:MAG: hypothetical protein U5L96_07170 [Owenweeksia sp.]|nr:hypothetical protein [Owenweeksia sp.]